MNKRSTLTNLPEKLIAAILIGTAIFGWLISLSGLVLLWASYRPVKKTTMELVEVTSGALQVSSQTIVLLENSLIQAEGSLNEITHTSEGFSSVVDNTSSVLEEVSQILGDEFIKILRGTSAGMEGLEKTSRLIDGTLVFISSIPFLGGDRYEPEVPLAESVAGIRRDLEAMPLALEGISDQINETAIGLQPLPTAMENLNVHLEGIQKNLVETRRQLEEYQSLIETYQNQLENLKNNLPAVITSIYITLSLLLLWIALAQTGLFTQGIERLGKNKSIKPEHDHLQ